MCITVLVRNKVQDIMIFNNDMIIDISYTDIR